ncbi:MAG: hypothetical protein ACP5KV_05975 [Candidatus Methanomethylicaceae archaeon]
MADLNACVNISHRLMSSMGWGRSGSYEPASGGEKPALNAGSSRL